MIHDKIKKEVILRPRKPAPCIETQPDLKEPKSVRAPLDYDAFPRDFKFAYMTPGYYVKGFRILDVYKTEVDFSEYRSLLFIEDLNLVHKWGHLKSRIPFPVGRITDLPGTRDLHYRNYCLRNMTPESARSWRQSITSPPPPPKIPEKVEECEPKAAECVCKNVAIPSPGGVPLQSATQPQGVNVFLSFSCLSPKPSRMALNSGLAVCFEAREGKAVSEGRQYCQFPTGGPQPFIAW